MGPILPLPRPALTPRLQVGPIFPLPRPTPGSEAPGETDPPSAEATLAGHAAGGVLLQQSVGSRQTTRARKVHLAKCLLMPGATGGNDDSTPLVSEEDGDEPKAGHSRFASVSAGNSHTCGVRLDGSLSCWALRPATDRRRPSAGRRHT